MIVYKETYIIDFFSGLFMKHGNALKPRKITRNLLKYVMKKTGKNAIILFYLAAHEVRPVFKLHPLRVGTDIYQIAGPISYMKSIQKALKYLLISANKRKGRNIIEKVYNEFYSAAIKRRGGAMKMVVSEYKLALGNRDFGHYRWY